MQECAPKRVLHRPWLPKAPQAQSWPVRTRDSLMLLYIMTNITCTSNMSRLVRNSHGRTSCLQTAFSCSTETKEGSGSITAFFQTKETGNRHVLLNPLSHIRLATFNACYHKQQSKFMSVESQPHIQLPPARHVLSHI